MNKKLFIILFIMLDTLVGAQNRFKDTLYIYFDSLQPTMKKALGYDKQIPKYDLYETNRYYGTYFIDEKPAPNPEMLDTGYEFAYWEHTPFLQALSGFRSSMALVRDQSFLKKIKPLDHTFFETTEYIKVCKTFEAEDSREQDVIIFVIDKDEIKDGKIILREVFFRRPEKI